MLDWAKNYKYVFPALAGVILIKWNPSDFSSGFSRTRGGDPRTGGRRVCLLEVFPALAGVILKQIFVSLIRLRFSRTRGGDPKLGISYTLGR